MKHFRLAQTAVLAVSATAALPATSHAQQPVSPEQGIYVLINPKITPNGNPPMNAYYQTALKSPDVDGATIIIAWSDLYSVVNPGPQNYNWAHLDNWAAQAIAHNKKLSIGVVAGMNTPAWLLSPPYSVPAYHFTFNSGPASHPDCVTRLLPTPWNPTYLGAYTQMISDLSKHLRATGAYSALTSVKIDGLNEQTQELGIGATRAVDYNCPATGSQYLTQGWASVGYTPGLIMGAWTSISTAIAAAFPDQLLSVDILGSQQAFPSVANTGQIVAVPSGATDLVTAFIVATTLLPNPSLPGFHSRFSVQWDALSSGGVDPEVLTAGAMSGIVGWQMNDGAGPLGADCLNAAGGFTPCVNAGQFQAMLDNGINLGGQFIEIMPADVTLFPTALVEAHQRLTGSAQ